MLITLQEVRYRFSIISSTILVGMRNVSNKVRRQIKTQFFSNNFFSENLSVYDIMWKNTVEPRRPQMTKWRMRFACWISKATNIYSKYVIWLFQWNNGCTNACQCYVIRTFPVLM
jgi:hypothetical protein